MLLLPSYFCAMCDRVHDFSYSLFYLNNVYVETNFSFVNLSNSLLKYEQGLSIRGMPGSGISHIQERIYATLTARNSLLRLFC